MTIHSTDNIDEAIECMINIESILKHGRFHIKKWVMNGNSLTRNDIILLNTEEKYLVQCGILKGMKYVSE